MAETPNPTNEELDALEPTVNCRADLVQDEIIRRLGDLLPVRIPYVNERMDWTGTWKEIPVPSEVLAAPAGITSDHINKVLVRVTVETKDFGSGAFKHLVTVSITTIDQAIVAGQQVRVHWQRANQIRVILRPFLTGCVNADNQLCWRQLVPVSMSILPEGYEEFSGTRCVYQTTLTPNMN